VRKGKKRRDREGRGAKILRGKGGDVGGHEVSLVITATDKKRARRDYSFSNTGHPTHTYKCALT